MPETSEPRDRKTRLRKLAEVPRFSIESAHVHPERLLIERAGSEYKLDLRQMELLVALATAPGEEWSKNALMEQAWGTAVFTDSMLHKNMSILRDALGDDPKSPTCIQSLPKMGYRLIGQVRGIDNRLVNPLEAPNWAGLNPYVGLAAFDGEHEDVFFGRDDLIKRVHAAIRSQHRNGQGFVLIVGSSGCGKTSLLQAGVLPPMRRDGGVEGLQALALARCDFGAAQPGELLHHLAAALCTWQLHGRSVFHEPSATTLAETLTTRPNSLVTAIDDAWLKWPAALRDKATEDAHLLLVIDHAEALVGKQKDDAVDTRGNADLARECAEVETVVNALCSHPRVLVIAVVRGDYYAQLADALPVLMARKGGKGHVDVPLPQPAEITQMIRGPAVIARLTFDQRPSDGARLDDVLRDATIGQPDALPLLQHTLAALCDARGEQDTLSFSAYEAMGGLEGALARRAEDVFQSLPSHVQQQHDVALSLLIRLEGDTDRVRGQSALWSMLPDDPARAFVNAFINARLFVSGGSESRLAFRVAHEALLRQWPRARNWAQDNIRLLHARERLRSAAKRWDEDGRRDDHLLNPGRPLDEAMEVRERILTSADIVESALIARSEYIQRRSRFVERLAISVLLAATTSALALAYAAYSAEHKARLQKQQASKLASFLMGELIDQIDARGDLKLLSSVAEKVGEYCESASSQRDSEEMLISCAKTYRKITDVNIEMRDFQDANISVGKAERYAAAAINRSGGSPASLIESSRVAAFHGMLRKEEGKIRGARHHWGRQLSITKNLLNDDPNNPEYLIEKSYALTNIGAMKAESRDYQAALSMLKESIDLKKSAMPRVEHKDLLQYELLVSESFSTRIKEQIGDSHEIDHEYEIQIAKLKILLEKNPEKSDWEQQITSLLQMRAVALINKGDFQKARMIAEEAESRLSHLTKKEPDNAQWKRFHANSIRILSEISLIENKTAESAKLLEKGLLLARSIPNNEGNPSKSMVLMEFYASTLSKKAKWEKIAEISEKRVREEIDMRSKSIGTALFYFFLARRMELVRNNELAHEYRKQACEIMISKGQWKTKNEHDACRQLTT